MTLARRILDEKRRYIYPIVVAIVINVALFLAVLLPLQRKVSGGELEAQAAAAALSQARRENAAAKATVSGKVSADQELKKFYGAVLPATWSAARNVTVQRMNQLAKEHQVHLERGTAADPEQERGSELGKLTVTYVLSGEYANIRRFIHELETTPEFLILENVSLSQGAEEGSELIVNLQVSTYYRAGAAGTNGN